MSEGVEEAWGWVRNRVNPSNCFCRGSPRGRCWVRRRREASDALGNRRGVLLRYTHLISSIERGHAAFRAYRRKCREEINRPAQATTLCNSIGSSSLRRRRILVTSSVSTSVSSSVSSRRRKGPGGVVFLLISGPPFRFPASRSSAYLGYFDKSGRAIANVPATGATSTKA
jgi:hypothetical protein